MKRNQVLQPLLPLPFQRCIGTDLPPVPSPTPQASEQDGPAWACGRSSQQPPQGPSPTASMSPLFWPPGPC